MCPMHWFDRSTQPLSLLAGPLSTHVLVSHCQRELFRIWTFVLTGTDVVHAAVLMQVGQQSKAAMSLCLWVRAMDTYATVYRIVEPKRQALAAAQAALDASNAALAEKQMQLQAIKDKVAALQQQLTDTQKQLAALQFQVRACQ